jgi:predicted RNA-binding protein
LAFVFCGSSLSSQGVEIAMCEARVFLIGDEGEHKLMDDVVLLQPEGDAYLIVNLLGEQKLVHGSIKRIDFLKHTVHLSESSGVSKDVSRS